MAKKLNDREAREARARVRAYRARQTMHERAMARRRRDNIVALIAVFVVLGAVVAAQVVFFVAGPGKPVPSASASPAPTTAPPRANQGNVPDPSLAEARTWNGSLTINGIQLGIELDGANATQGVASTISLIRSGFYEGTVCHRLTTAETFKVLQCGDPTGSDEQKAGTGGPGYSYGPIENAPADNVYPAGTIAMARRGNDAFSMGSQFFIVYRDTTIPADSAGGYTVLGTVTSGLTELEAEVISAGVADGKQDGKPVTTPTIESFTIE